MLWLKNQSKKMTLLRTDNIKIAGISACVPSHIVYNNDYDRIPDDERKKLIEVTGIHQRHVASDRITTSDMCFVAARKLLHDMNISPSDIGFLVFVSQSRDYYLPHTSAILHHRLSLPETTPAFDISLGCSGYPYALSVISSMMNHADCEFGLLLAGDISTRTTPVTDKSTYPLFGDAGTATILTKTKESHPSIFNFGNDGSRHEAIIIRNGYFRNGFPPEGFEKIEISPGIIRSKMDLELNGTDVFHFSITDVPVSVKKILKATGFVNDYIDFFIFHQANKLIVETITKILKLSSCKVPQNLDRFGNTSIASIPLCMVTELKKDLGSRKLRLLLSGFGVGLSWGNAIIETNHVHISDLQYLDI
jgi:3-oxoacyl-[acyl-carrier-protein] synthase III